MTPRGMGGRLVGAGLGAWFLVPLVPLIVWALADRWTWPAVLPQRWGLRGWSTFGADGMGSALVASTLLGGAVAVGATPLGALAGRALGWHRTPRPGVVTTVLLAPVALPPFAVAMGADAVLLRTGLPAPAAVVLLLVVFALPYTTTVYRAGYAGLDERVEEQARMLGAGPRQAFVRVTFPALRGATATAAAVAFLVGAGDYIVTVVVGGGRVVTAPVLVAASASGPGNEPTAAAYALTSVAPLALVALAAAVLARRRRGSVTGAEGRR